MNKTPELRPQSSFLFDYGIDILKMDDEFNSHLFAAMERYAEAYHAQFTPSTVEQGEVRDVWVEHDAIINPPDLYVNVCIKYQNTNTDSDEDFIYSGGCLTRDGWHGHLHKNPKVVSWLSKQTIPAVAVADELTVQDYKEVIEDNKRLVRELDFLLNGENAAKQASLCDIVSQLKNKPPNGYTIEQVAEAHMAGQLNAGCKHPSSYEATAYLSSIKPADTNVSGDGRVSVELGCKLPVIPKPYKEEGCTITPIEVPILCHQEDSIVLDWYDDSGIMWFELKEYTHWQPLPEPPKQKPKQKP